MTILTEKAIAIKLSVLLRTAVDPKSKSLLTSTAAAKTLQNIYTLKERFL